MVNSNLSAWIIAIFGACPSFLLPKITDTIGPLIILLFWIVIIEWKLSALRSKRIAYKSFPPPEYIWFDWDTYGKDKFLEMIADTKYQQELIEAYDKDAAKFGIGRINIAFLKSESALERYVVNKPQHPSNHQETDCTQSHTG